MTCDTGIVQEQQGTVILTDAQDVSIYLDIYIYITLAKDVKKTMYKTLHNHVEKKA